MLGLYKSAIGAALLNVVASVGARDTGPAAPRKRAVRKAVPSVNRHTGQPHKHEREIARRLRQQARLEAKRAV